MHKEIIEEKVERKIGICYDKEGVCSSHKCKSGEYCYELPERLHHLNEKLEKSDIFNSLIQIPPRDATVDEMCICHSRKLVEEIISGDILKKERWEEIDKSEAKDTDDDEEDLYLFYIPEHTPKAVVRSCGSTINMVEEVFTKRAIDTGFVLFRPPGHHARYDLPMGYCFINHVCVAALIAQQKFEAKKVAIFDFDVHHGNGTQELREKNKDILYISTHRFFYPFTGEIEDVGEGKLGNTINIQFPNSYGDAELISAVEEIVIPAINEFQPDLLFLSAGYDASVNDPLGECSVHPKTYGFMIRRIFKLCGAKKSNNIVAVLEGGYHLETTSTSVLETLKGMMYVEKENEEKEEEDQKYISSMRQKCEESARRTINQVKNIQRKYFKCFENQVPEGF